MMRVLAALTAMILGWSAATAQDRAGEFDHYMLALSWSPTWCAEEPDREDAAQCRRGMGFVVHGLWPQHENGWPEFCRTDRRDPTRRETAAMADVMGSGGLAWHAWRKHGRCADMDPADYFALTRRALAAIRIPDALARLRRDVRIDPEVIEAAFLEANADLEEQGIVTRCRDGRFYELRLCLGRDLSPQRCAGEAARDCRASRVELFAPK
jgi:ribonuclease T2